MGKAHEMINLNTVTNIQKMKSKPNQHSNLRTAHICVYIIVHNCHIQHSIQQF